MATTALAPPTAPAAMAAETSPVIESLDLDQARQLRLRALIESAPAGYEDRFMSTEDAGPPQAAAADVQPEGLRAWALESRLGWGQSDSTGIGRRRATEFGQRFEYRQQTLNHGEWLLQADLRHLNGDAFNGAFSVASLGYARERSSARLSVRNLGFPITPTLFADSVAGDTYSELTDGLARNYRFSLGTTSVRGLATRLYGADLDLRAGSGQRGDLTGGPFPGFERTQGSLSWLGATRRLGERWYVAGQIDHAQSVPAYVFSTWTPYSALQPLALFSPPWATPGFGTKNVTSWATALGYGQRDEFGEGTRLRATLVGSTVDSPSAGVPTGGARGLFVEASTNWGRARHVVGAHAADPNLHFGDNALQTGTRGAFWRYDDQAGRLHWGGSLDAERGEADGVVSFTGYRRASASGNFQLLLDRRSSVGANLSLARTSYSGPEAQGVASQRSSSAYAYGFYQTRFGDWPRTRLSATVRRNEAIALGSTNATGQELQWEQDWIGGRHEGSLPPELSTTLGYAHDTSSGQTRRYPTAGVQFRWWLDPSLMLAGNLRYTSQQGGLSTSRGLSGTVSAEKQLTGGWKLGLQASLNQARTVGWQTAAYLPQVYRSNNKTVYVYARWEGSAGRPFESAGVRHAPSGAGTGRVAGRVFLDANRDGEAQPGETGPAGIEVLLDGRYRALTDSQGRFEFPVVTVGRHQLTLTLDTVPLPWGAARDEGTSVNVPLRGTAETQIPLVRLSP